MYRADIGMQQSDLLGVRKRNDRSPLTIDFKRRTSSSCATTLLRRPFLRRSVLSSPLITLSITSLSSDTLFPYAITAPYGSSFVESSFTASRASSSALVSARRDEGGRGSELRGSGGERSRRSGTMSLVVGDRAPDRSRDGGGESERLSTDEDAALDA